MDAVPSVTLNVKFPTSIPLSIVRVTIAVIPSTTITVDSSKEISNSENVLEYKQKSKNVQMWAPQMFAVLLCIIDLFGFHG